jgi:hypothetical protein
MRLTPIIAVAIASIAFGCVGFALEERDISRARAAAPLPERDGLPLVFHEDFKDPEKGFGRFDFLDPKDWKMAKDGDRNVLSLFQKPTNESAGKPPVRSPFGRAMIKDLYVGECVMEVRFKSTIKPYGHQDLCLYFGEVDVSHLYYVHFGREPDPNAGNIFIVNGAPRKNLLPPHKKTTDWTENYHTATVIRKADGKIDVRFDDKPYLAVDDKTFPVGRVGVGSFDDTGDFAEITVWGKKAEKPAAPEEKTVQKPASK